MRLLCRLLPLLLCCASGVALAHGGHGAPEVHLHDHEALGLWVLVGLSAGAAAWIWFSGREDR
jgi:hypothetical protein